MLHLVNGYLESRIVSFMMNLHISPRTVYLCRRGETIYDLQGRVGGDSKLSPGGMEYASKLAALFEKEVKDMEEVQVFTSTLTRCYETARTICEKSNFMLV